MLQCSVRGMRPAKGKTLAMLVRERLARGEATEFSARNQDATAARPLAEVMPPAIAAAAVSNFETRQMPAGLFHSAWSHVEYAMNQECPPEETQYYLETANYLTGEVITRPDTHQDMRLGALLLSTYAPLLGRRAAGEHAVEKKDCDEVYHSIGQALNYLRPLDTNEPPQWRMVEAAVLALSARIRRPELLLYPASPREEQSSNQRLNHDSYFYTGHDKLPVQQKLLPTQKVYDDCITVLTLNPLIDKALRTSQGAPDAPLADKVNYLLSLIVAETAGEELDKSEHKFLSFLTRAVAAHHKVLAQ